MVPAILTWEILNIWIINNKCVFCAIDVVDGWG